MAAFKLAHGSELLVLAMSIFLVGAGSAGATPDSGQPQVHVYPGAQSISSDGQAAVDGDTPVSSPTQTEPSAAVGDNASVSGSGANDTSYIRNDQAGGTSEPSAGAGQPGNAGPEEVSNADPEAAELVQARLQNEATQHYSLAAHYFNKWELDMAEVEFDETVAIFPEFKVAHRDLCLLSLVKFNLPRSLAEFMMVTGIGEPTAYSDKDKFALDEKALRAHYEKGLKFGTENKWKDATTEFQWALTYAPENPAIHHSLAFAYGSAGDFQKAESEYRQTFESAPGDSMAHADFANLLADKGQIQRAEDEMRKAVTLTPNHAALHVDLGWLAESHSDFKTAAAEFKEAVKLSPRHAGLWTHLGRLLEREGDVDDAKQAYAQALALDPAQPEAKQSLDRLKQKAEGA